MLNGKLRWLSLAFCLLCSFARAQEPTTLETGKVIEREIAGGQTHTYQIKFTAGQFLRVVVEQQGIDVALALTSPDAKPLIESDVTSIIGARESLSYEATAAGNYQLVIRANGAATQSGAYQVRLEVKASASAQDRQRMAAELLLNEASRLYAQGQYADPQLSERLGQALALWRELDDRYWQGFTLNLIGLTHYGARQFDKAIERYGQALALWREEKLRAGEATVLSNLGNAYYNLSRYEEALKHYEQALQIYREVKNRAGEGDAFKRLGAASDYLSRYKQAIGYYEQSLEISREIKNRVEEGNALNNLGLAYMGMSQNEKSIGYYEQALAIYREIKNQDKEGNVLNKEGNTLGNLGLAYSALSQYAKSIGYFEQALAIYREIKDRGGEGFALRGLGRVYRVLNRYEQAISHQEQALALFRAVKNRTGEAEVLNGLGIVYYELGQYEKANSYYEESLAISREIKNRLLECGVLQSLGNNNSSMGRYEQAISHYEQMLSIAREIKYRAGEESGLANLGDAYRKLSQYQRAISYYEQALSISREIKDRNAEATLLNELGLAYHALSRYEKAIEHQEQALTLSREVKSPVLVMSALTNLANAERYLGNLPAARTHLEQALQIIELLRKESVGPSPEARTSFFADVQNTYRLYTDVLMRLHQVEPTKGFDALAVETSEQRRARSLLDRLTEAKVDLREGVDAALLERERSLSKQLNNKALQLLQARPEQAQALKKEIGQLENDYERAQVAIKKASPQYAALTQPQPLKLREIQAQLDADTLLLEYSLGEERSFLWAITKDSLKSYELPPRKLIDKDARQLHELLSARSASIRGESALQRQERIAQADRQLPAAAQALSQTLLAPVAPELGNKRLAIVADIALQYVPFAMLPEPKAEGGRMRDEAGKGGNLHPSSLIPHPLIVGHEVVSLSSASALAIQRNELAGRQPAPKLLAVIADPVFDSSDVRFKTAAPDANDNAMPQTRSFDDERSIEHLSAKSDEKAGDKSGVTTRRLVIPRLPYTREEATRLLALVPRTASFAALGFQANNATVQKGDLAQYRYVHFATHGLADTEKPWNSSLVLSLVNAEGQPQNGFLRLKDIYNMKLPAELVVLSACQTGIGKEIRGEGMEALTRGFMNAGAARVVVSLWSVNDKATAELMAKFYQKMLKEGQAPAAALRAAQVEMWKQKQWQAPFYWAAFTLQGEWK